MRIHVCCCLFVLCSASLAAGGRRPCEPVWSAPSPTLDDRCYHASGAPFATCTCDRAYTSPHILGYGGHQGCPAHYRRRGCLGRRYSAWSPAYCDGRAGPDSFDVQNGPHLAGPDSGGCSEYSHPYHVLPYIEVGFHHLGQIPSDALLDPQGGLSGVPPARAGASGLPSDMSALGELLAPDSGAAGP